MWVNHQRRSRAGVYLVRGASQRGGGVHAGCFLREFARGRCAGRRRPGVAGREGRPARGARPLRGAPLQLGMAWITKNSAGMKVERRDQPYFTAGMREKFTKEILPRYETKLAALLPCLHAVQHEHGWIPA